MVRKSFSYISITLALLGAGLQAPFLSLLLPDQLPGAEEHLPPAIFYSIGLWLSIAGLIIYALARRLGPTWCLLSLAPVIVPSIGTIIAALVLTQQAHQADSKKKEVKQ